MRFKLVFNSIPRLVITSLVFSVMLFPGRSWGQGNYWFELLTNQPQVSEAFYEGLFGWQIEPYQRDYWVIRHEDASIGGFMAVDGPLPDSQDSLWLMALAVQDIDKSIELALESGASVLREPEVASMMPRIGVITDPTGVPIMLINTQHLGLTPAGAGTWAWAELWTDDVARAREFYAEIPGVDIQAGTPRGHTVRVNGTPWASISPPALETLSTAWMPHVEVEGIEAITARVVELGGKVLEGPTAVADGHRRSIIQDPVGAVIAIYE